MIMLRNPYACTKLKQTECIPGFLTFTSSFYVIVKTRSSKTEIIGFDATQNAYRMNVHAPPEEGKANREIIRFFKKEHKLDVEIVSGFTSRRKLLKILSKA